jgi:hypothetical protein
MNDLDASMGEGWVAQPGVYSFRVVYDSAGSARPVSEAVWTGTATSNAIQIRVRPATVEERRWRLGELQACLAKTCNTQPLANFYRVVQDRAAAALLPRVLRGNPYDVWLLDAIRFQGRAEDAATLRDLAGAISDETIRKEYLDAASYLSRKRPGGDTGDRSRKPSRR